VRTSIVIDCLGLVSENYWDVSSRTKNRTSRSRLGKFLGRHVWNKKSNVSVSSRSRVVLVNVSFQSRLGCNVKRLSLGPEGLVHIPGQWQHVIPMLDDIAIGCEKSSTTSIMLSALAAPSNYKYETSDNNNKNGHGSARSTIHDKDPELSSCPRFRSWPS